MRPANTFVAGFVGHPPMNLIRGAFGDSAFASNGFRLALPFHVPSQVLLTVEAGGSALKMLTDARPAPGAAVGLGVDPARLHLFDASGQRMEVRA